MTLVHDHFAVPSKPVLSFDGFHLHSDGTLFHDETQIHLAPKELAALRLLLREAGRIVTPAQLQQELWGDVHVTPDSVPRCISSLRTRLGQDSSIQTVYKQGYRLMAQVQQEPDPANHDLPRLAIMPFSAGPGVPEHLGSIVAEEATAQLTLLEPRIFSMLARDSVFTLASHGLGAQQVGETLNADLVLTGTLRGMAAHFRLRCEMVRVADGTQIWVEDVLIARDRMADLAADVVDRLAFRAGGALPAAAPAALVDAHAYDLFVHGRNEWQTLDRNRMQEGIRTLQRAADLDPNFAQASVDIIRASIAREMFGFIEPAEAGLQVHKSAEKLGDHPASAPSVAPALAWMAFHLERDLPAALRYLHGWDEQHAQPWGLRLCALLAAGRHHFGEATGILERALGADPYSPWMAASLAWIHHLAGRADESLRLIHRCLEIAPEHPASCLYGGMILAFHGDTRRAIQLTSELTQHASQFDIALAVHAYALARDGQRAEAEECLERLEWLSRERYVIRSFSAAPYLALGNEDAALAELAAANQSRCPWFFQMLADPRLEPLHHRPEMEEFRAMLDQMEADPAPDPPGEYTHVPAEMAR